VSDILRHHLDALEATVRLALAQLEAARHAMGQEAPPSATVSLPARCAGVAADRCAEQDGDWAETGTLADPSARKCRGCGHVDRVN
jgi:hypothetical protein